MKKCLSKIHCGYQKTQNFMLISKMLTERQNKIPMKVTDKRSVKKGYNWKNSNLSG